VRLVVVCPHFEPDVAPTGAVMTRLVEELARRGHTLEVVTSLPWYRNHEVEERFAGRLVRHEDSPWGHITRIHPFPTVDKRNLLGRALAFAGFSVLAGVLGARGPRADGVLAVSPPLTLGLAGWSAARARHAPLVFNIQDVYPDVAVELGMLTNRRLVAVAQRLERLCYERATAVTVLSDDLRDNVSAKLAHDLVGGELSAHAEKVRVIPNFVDTEWIRPGDRDNGYRREHGLTGKFVVMYAGNVGLSQPLDLVLEAARAFAHEPDVAFVINGQGAGRAGLEARAAGLSNVVFVDMQPSERLPELLAAGDVHLVLLRRGLARASVPSKTYSILAAGRPLIASVDSGTEVARVVEGAGAGIAVPAEDSEALTNALARLVTQRDEAVAMGLAGRAFVESWASPAVVAEAYEALFCELGRATTDRATS
jgi:colanic acid biosynthesis glycosyl transferase WcaI